MSSSCAIVVVTNEVVHIVLQHTMLFTHIIKFLQCFHNVFLLVLGKCYQRNSLLRELTGRIL